MNDGSVDLALTICGCRTIEILAVRRRRIEATWVSGLNRSGSGYWLLSRFDEILVNLVSNTPNMRDTGEVGE